MPLILLGRRLVVSTLPYIMATALYAQADYVPVTAVIGDPQSVDVDISELREAIDGSSVTTAPAPEFSRVEFVSGSSFKVTGLEVGTDRIALRYCDATSACDTAYFEIVSELPREITPVVVYDTIGVPGAIRTVCIDTSELPGVVTTVRDICDGEPRQFVEFTYSERSQCIKYRGLALGGTDSTCMVVCDDLGFCDTTTVIVTTRQPEPFPDAELEFWIDLGQSDFTVLDLTEFRSSRFTLENDCPDASGTYVDFGLDAAATEVSFEGLAVGTERACVLAAAADGERKTFAITVHVVTRSPGIDSIRIPAGELRTWCFGEYELVGAPERLFDDCVDVAPKVSLATTSEPVCVDITAGAELGFQRLCMNLCDAGGRCDLVTLTVEVYQPDPSAPPIAIDDLVAVPATNTVTYVILDNDKSDAAITSVAIVSNPVHGTARLDAGDRLVYDRDPGAPCRDDMLVYEICNVNGCDRATVTLSPACDNAGARGTVRVSEAVSPNDDGINDEWTIQNITDYPDNEVRVFNRWGGRVYRERGYDNTWQGTFQDGKPLPDGTYFYHVVVEGGERISGRFQLRR